MPKEPKPSDATTDEVDPSPPPVASDIFGDRIDLAVAYRDILASDGIVRGLMGPREVPRLWDRHILNCAVMGEVIEEDVRVVDIGSGAGLPGLPLAIARPDLTVTLVETLLRRSTFLSEVVEKLGLDNVIVLRGRAEDKTVVDTAGDADVVTSRAVAPLDRLAKWSAPLIRTGGHLIAIKGSSVGDEIDRDGSAAERAGIIRLRSVVCGVDQLDQPTTLVIGDKVARGGKSRSAKQKKQEQSSEERSRG